MATKSPKLQPLPPAPGSQPAPVRLADAAAIQAFARFEADPEQQRIAWDWIMKKACGIGAWAYNESQRETDLMLGRQFVGQQIMGAVNINLSTLRGKENAT